jgi:hypothetical protein
VAALFPPKPRPPRAEVAVAAFEVVSCAGAGETVMTNNPTMTVKKRGEANEFMVEFRCYDSTGSTQAGKQ